MQVRINRSNITSTIKLSEGKAAPEVQILRTGKFNHPTYGHFEITKQVLSEMKDNFDNKIRGVDVCFDYFHKSDEEASGWPGSLELREDGTELWAIDVQWTPKAAQKLSDREVRYFSPDFSFKWKDPETGVTHSNVLFGGGLTNRPFVKEMAAIVAHEQKGETMTELEKAQAALKASEEKAIKLSEQVAKLEGDVKANEGNGDAIAALKAEIEALKKENASLKEASTKAIDDAKKAEEQKVLAEKKTAFQKLLSEGKAVAAQEDAFVKGDMEAFIKLSEPVNLNGKGGSKSGDNDGGDQEDKILKLAEEKRKADGTLSFGDSISLAKREVEKK